MACQEDFHAICIKQLKGYLLREANKALAGGENPAGPHTLIQTTNPLPRPHSSWPNPNWNAPSPKPKLMRPSEQYAAGMTQMKWMQAVALAVLAGWLFHSVGLPLI